MKWHTHTRTHTQEVAGPSCCLQQSTATRLVVWHCSFTSGVSHTAQHAATGHTNIQLCQLTQARQQSGPYLSRSRGQLCFQACCPELQAQLGRAGVVGQGTHGSPHDGLPAVTLPCGHVAPACLGSCCSSADCSVSLLQGQGTSGDEASQHTANLRVWHKAVSGHEQSCGYTAVKQQALYDESLSCPVDSCTEK